jgi:uncharacterized protein YjbI with pentapeptide repeats
LSKADLDKVTFKGTLINEETKLNDKWRLVHRLVNEGGRNEDLSGEDLSNANLYGVDLRNANLSGTALKGTLINEETKLDDKWRLVHRLVNEGGRNEDLSREDLSNACLYGADLRGTDLSNVNLSGTALKGTLINEETKLDDKWRLVHRLVNEGGRNEDLSGKDLSNACLRLVNFRDANLKGTNLKETDLWCANLKGANLKGAKNLTPQQVQSAQNWEKAEFDDDFQQQIGLPLQSEQKPSPRSQ